MPFTVFSVKLRRVGTKSVGLTIPKSETKFLNLKPGDEVVVAIVPVREQKRVSLTVKVASALDEAFAEN